MTSRRRHRGHRAPRRIASRPVNVAPAEAEAVATDVDVAQTVTQDGTGAASSSRASSRTVEQAARAVATAHSPTSDSLHLGDRPPGVSSNHVVRSDAVASLAAGVHQDVDQVLVSTDRVRGRPVERPGGPARAARIRCCARRPARRAPHGRGRPRRDRRGACRSRARRGAARRAGRPRGRRNADQSPAQLALVEQTVDASSTVVQTGGAARRGRSGGTAVAGTLAGGVALVGQAAHQAAARGAGAACRRRAARLRRPGCLGARDDDVQQAGTAALPTRIERRSRARTGPPSSRRRRRRPSGRPRFDAQDLVQQSIVVPEREGRLVVERRHRRLGAVSNCAVVQQGAAQGLGASAAPRAEEISRCSASRRRRRLMSTDPGTTAARSPRRSPRGLSPTGAGAPRSTTNRCLPRRAPMAGADRPTAATSRVRRPGLRPGAPEPGQTRCRAARGHHKFSVLPSPQARLDTRPGSHAGAGDAGREPPLPPAGDPPPWVSALAARRRAQGRRGSQRSSWPSCSCRRSCCARGKDRSSGDRSTSSHRSTSRSDLFVTPRDPLGLGPTGDCQFGCDERK